MGIEIAAIRMIARFLVLPVAMSLLLPAPASATEFTLNVAAGPGANPVHGGRWVVDVTYDPKTKLVTFTVVKANPGEEMYNGWTYTAPATVQLDGTITFDGATNVPTKGDGSPGKQSDVITFNGTSYDPKKGKLGIKSIDNGGFNFPIGSIHIIKQAKKANNTKSADTSVPDNKSIDFNSALGLLSITGSTVVGLPTQADPLLGASVTYPSFTLSGFSSDADSYIFTNQDLTDKLSISDSSGVFETSSISAVLYDVADNVFYGVPFSNTFNADGSSFIQSTADALDPSSPLYDPIGLYYIEIQPNGNFFSLTRGFQSSYDVGGMDYHFISDGVPEPWTWEMIVIGSALLGLARRSRRTESGIPLRGLHPQFS